MLKLLSLSQKIILKLKFLDVNKARKESPKAFRFIKIKILIFFLVGISLLFFSWYYISSFCIVFENSQIDLIKNITISFCISNSYPFVISVITAFLRILSLKDRKKDKKCLYDISKIISMI